MRPGRPIVVTMSSSREPGTTLLGCISKLCTVGIGEPHGVEYLVAFIF
ncbi:hypothetical protein Hdeb2414_s0003g00101781 [Helianthus debilis subsp. tardiflorus]